MRSPVVRHSNRRNPEAPFFSMTSWAYKLRIHDGPVFLSDTMSTVQTIPIPLCVCIILKSGVRSVCVSRQVGQLLPQGTRRASHDCRCHCHGSISHHVVMLSSCHRLTLMFITIIMNIKIIAGPSIMRNTTTTSTVIPIIQLLTNGISRALAKVPQSCPGFVFALASLPCSGFDARPKNMYSEAK